MNSVLNVSMPSRAEATFLLVKKIVSEVFPGSVSMPSRAEATFLRI